MRTRVHRWGHSLGIPIPEALAQEAGLDQDSSVDITLSGGRILVTPITETRTLERLLAGISSENVHREMDSELIIGREMW